MEDLNKENQQAQSTSGLTRRDFFKLGGAVLGSLMGLGGKSQAQEPTPEVIESVDVQIDRLYVERPDLQIYLRGQIEAAKLRNPEIANFFRGNVKLITGESAFFPTFAAAESDIFAPTGDGYELQKIGTNPVGWEGNSELLDTVYVFPLHTALLASMAEINDENIRTVRAYNPGDMYYLGGYGNGQVSIEGGKFIGDALNIVSIGNGRFINESPFPMFLEGYAQGFNGPITMQTQGDVTVANLPSVTWEAYDIIKLGMYPDYNDQLTFTQRLSNKNWDPSEAPFNDSVYEG